MFARLALMMVRSGQARSGQVKQLLNRLDITRKLKGRLGVSVPAKGAEQKYRFIQGIPLRWMRRPTEMSQALLGSSKIPDSQKQYVTLDMAAGPTITSFCSELRLLRGRLSPRFPHLFSQRPRTPIVIVH